MRVYAAWLNGNPLIAQRNHLVDMVGTAIMRGVAADDAWWDANEDMERYAAEGQRSKHLRTAEEWDVELKKFDAEHPEALREIGQSILDSWNLHEGDMLAPSSYMGMWDRLYVRLSPEGMPYVERQHPVIVRLEAGGFDPEAMLQTKHISTRWMVHYSERTEVPGFQDWYLRTPEWEERSAAFNLANGVAVWRYLA